MAEIAFFEETATLASQFESMIRQAAQELWRGDIYRPTFVSRMNAILKDGLTRAWIQGMRDVGLKFEDITQAERDVLAQLIIANQRYVPDFMNWIFYNNRHRGGAWLMISNRVKLWGNRYTDTRNRAKAMAQNDPKLEWELGATKDHCKTCSALAGKVKRSSYWSQHAIFPQNPPNDKLDCGGWRCGCKLTPTDAPLSRGRLPGEGR